MQWTYHEIEFVFARQWSSPYIRCRNGSILRPYHQTQTLIQMLRPQADIGPDPLPLFELDCWNLKVTVRGATRNAVAKTTSIFLPMIT